MALDPNFKQRFAPRSSGSKRATSLQPSSNAALPEGLGEGLVIYSSRILRKLRQNPDRSMPLFEIADSIPARVEALLPVIQLLAKQGFIERVKEDPSGNDVYHLTPTGNDIPA